MKKQHLALLLLLNLGLLFSAKTQTVLREFVDLKKIEQLSSNNEESMPFPYLNGTKMYFVRTIIVGSMKQRMTGQDIWSSEFDGDSWASPSNLFDEANDNGNNAVIGVSNDGNTLYLFNSVQTRRKLAQGIAVTRRDPQGNWSDLEQVDVPGFKVGQGLYSLYVAPNEKTLLIGMSVSDSSTQSDLFVSLKNEEGNWGELKDLGSTINTEGTEITPFIGEDGTSLYFSSDGHKGMGGMDVFTAQRLDDSWANWTTPVNLGAPVNSDEFDAYFMLCNNKEAVLTSNRAGLFSDIYWTTLKQEKEEKIAAKEVRVLAQMYFKKGPAKGIDLLILDVQGNLIEKITTNEKGEFSFPEAEDQTYNVQLDSPDSSLQADANIYLTDDYGFKLERLNRNTEGVYTDIVSQQEAEKVEGIFEYKSSPQENVTLIVYDENNFPIDTLVTDAQGKFIYKKLKADNNFTIRPLMFSEDNLVDDMEIFTTDSSGEKLDKVVVNTTKVIEEAEKEIFLAKLKEEELAAKKGRVLAQMYFKKGPAKGIDLLILDAQGNLIEKITTNEKGEFSFPEAEDQTYNVQLDSPDSSLQADANIYLTDDYGFKLERLNRNAEGVYTDIVGQQEVEKVEGIFEYKSSPQENVTLIVYDENNFPIDTLVTDAQGKFIYKKLKADNNFTIRPLMFSEDNLVDDMEIFTTDSSGEKLDKVVVNTTKVIEEAEKEIFLAKLKEEELAAKKGEILALSDNNQASTSSHKTPAENTNKAALQSSDQIIYFDFNQRVLTADDKVTLNKIINSLKNNTNFKVTLIGFTDNIGSVENNVTVASARARAARAYLTENGVSLKRITIYGYGEVMFKADNSTDEGRALNRRVEIELK